MVPKWLISKSVSQMKNGVDGSWRKAWVIELFVLDNDCCLSILAEEFIGYKRNCIFFNDQNETHVFNMEDRSFGDLQNIHPSWLLSNLLQAYIRKYTSNNFLFGDLNLKQRNRKRMCNATVREKRIEIYCFLPEMVLAIFNCSKLYTFSG